MKTNKTRIEDFKIKVEQINNVSPTFCLAKWLTSTTTLYNGFTHSCHHPSSHKINIEDIKDNPAGLHNTPTKIAARQDMLNGVQTKECDYCWNIENLGKDHFSDRHYKSTNMGMNIWPNFKNVVDSGLGENIAPTYLEIAFENICNFKCSYCSPDVSSRWMEEIQEHGSYVMPSGELHHDLAWMKSVGKFPIHHKQQNEYIDTFWKWWPELYKSLSTFRITGGEPLLSDNTWKILDYVIANPRPDFKISVNTNMGIPRKLVEKLVSKLNELDGKIAEIIIFTSAESTGAQAEYSRFGMDWELFKSNVEYFLQNTKPGVKLYFMTTVNILSVSTFHEFLKYIMELRSKYGASRRNNRIGFDVAYLRWPQHQSITLLDKAQKGLFAERMKQTIADLTIGGYDDVLGNLYLEETAKIERLVDFMNSVEPDKKQLLALTAFFDEYDRRRNIKFLEVFPELTDTYNAGRK